jgi:hypothetical protein
MAVLRLELDIDSDVYPELYAQLVFINRSAARGERMRQLAATGLVWETVRIHGFAAAQLPAVPGLAPVPAPAPTPAMAPPALAAKSPVAAKSAPAAKPAAAPPAAKPAPARSPRAAPPKAARSPAPRAAAPATDFVDLGISAVPPEPEPPTPRLTPGQLAAAAGRLPVLVDVVDTDAPAVGMPVDVSEQAPLPDNDDAGHADSASIGAIAHRSGPRSRLIRMKERGLFKNG